MGTFWKCVLVKFVLNEFVLTKDLVYIQFSIWFFFRVLYSSPIIMTRTTCKQFLTNALLFQWRNILEWWWMTQLREEKCKQVTLIISLAHMIQLRVRCLFKLGLSNNNKPYYISIDDIQTIKIYHVLLHLQKTKTEHENNPASKGQKTL